MDIRTEKTKKAIKDSFIELSEIKDINKISVTELTEKAQIGRKTFYLHYGCINDVLDDILETLKGKVINSVSIYFSNAQNDIELIFSDLNKIINSNLPLAKKFAKEGSASTFRSMLETSLEEIITKIFIENYNVKSANLRYYARYQASGIVKLYLDWLNDKINVTIEELTRIVARSAFLGYKDLMLTSKA